MIARCLNNRQLIVTTFNHSYNLQYYGHLHDISYMGTYIGTSFTAYFFLIEIGFRFPKFNCWTVEATNQKDLDTVRSAICNNNSFCCSISWNSTIFVILSNDFKYWQSLFWTLNALCTHKRIWRSFFQAVFKPNLESRVWLPWLLIISLLMNVKELHTVWIRW